MQPLQPGASEDPSPPEEEESPAEKSEPRERVQRRREERLRNKSAPPAERAGRGAVGSRSSFDPDLERLEKSRRRFFAVSGFRGRQKTAQDDKREAVERSRGRVVK